MFWGLFGGFWGNFGVLRFLGFFVVFGVLEAAKVYLAGQCVTFSPLVGFVISYIRVEMESPTGRFNVNSCI